MLSREQVLSIFEQLQKLAKQVQADFEKDENCTEADFDEEKVMTLQYN